MLEGVRDALRRGERQRPRDPARASIGACGPTDSLDDEIGAELARGGFDLGGDGLDGHRLVAAFLGLLLGVRETREGLAGHGGRERPFARRVGALGGDERGEHAVVHEGRDRDALLLRSIRRRRLRVGRHRACPGLIDVRGDRAEQPAEREDDPAEDERERHIEARRRTRRPARTRPWMRKTSPKSSGVTAVKTSCSGSGNARTAASVAMLTRYQIHGSSAGGPVPAVATGHSAERREVDERERAGGDPDAAPDHAGEDHHRQRREDRDHERLMPSRPLVLRSERGEEGLRAERRANRTRRRAR